MGLFEQQPLLMIPFVLVVVAGYDIAKWAVKRRLSQTRNQAKQPIK